MSSWIRSRTAKVMEAENLAANFSRCARSSSGICTFRVRFIALTFVYFAFAQSQSGHGSMS